MVESKDFVDTKYWELSIGMCQSSAEDEKSNCGEKKDYLVANAKNVFLADHLLSLVQSLMWQI